MMDAFLKQKASDKSPVKEQIEDIQAKEEKCDKFNTCKSSPVDSVDEKPRDIFVTTRSGNESCIKNEAQSIKWPKSEFLIFFL